MLFSGIFTPIAGFFTHYFLSFFLHFLVLFFSRQKDFVLIFTFLMSRYDLSKGKNYKKNDIKGIYS